MLFVHGSYGAVGSSAPCGWGKRTTPIQQAEPITREDVSTNGRDEPSLPEMVTPKKFAKN